MVRRVLIAVVLVLLVSAIGGAWLWWHAQPSPKGEAYVGLDGVPLWNGVGQVRQRIRRLAWGEKVILLDRYGDSVEVRTPHGTIGWMDQTRLITPAVWHETGALAARVRRMSTQAQAHTAVLSNLRLDPGITSPRIGQLPPHTPVEILARGVAPAPAGSVGAGEPRKQDWLLVRAHLPEGGQMAGWVLGEFISLDLPDSLVGAASSAGLEPIACFPLRSVHDPLAGPKPYYLLAGSNGPEGQPCDFTMLRVYTWSVAHQQYETSFVQNNLCGRLPIHVTFSTDSHQDVFFHFRNLQPAGPQTLAFRMRSTIVSPFRAPMPMRNAAAEASRAPSAGR